MRHDRDLSRKLYERHSALCATLAHPRRLEILDLLRNGEQSVGELAEEGGWPQGNLSQHLALLRQRQVLRARREGARVYYRIANPKILEAFDMMRALLREQLAEEEAFVHSLRLARPRPAARTAAKAEA